MHAFISFKGNVWVWARLNFVSCDKNHAGHILCHTYINLKHHHIPRTILYCLHPRCVRISYFPWWLVLCMEVGDPKKWTIYDNGFVDHVPISNGYSHVTFYVHWWIPANTLVINEKKEKKKRKREGPGWWYFFIYNTCILSNKSSSFTQLMIFRIY